MSPQNRAQEGAIEEERVNESERAKETAGPRAQVTDDATQLHVDAGGRTRKRRPEAAREL